MTLRQCCWRLIRLLDAIDRKVQTAQTLEIRLQSYNNRQHNQLTVARFAALQIGTYANDLLFAISDLLLGFLMHRMLPAMFTEFGELETSFNNLFILLRMIVGLFAIGAFHFYYIVLGHILMAIRE